jgi:hypothetical protein
MADTLFIVPFQGWVYLMVYNLAARFWLADRALLLAGLLIQAVNEWMVTELYGPAISDFTLLSRGLLPAFFTFALFLLALGYLVAPFFRMRVVSLGKALGWLLFSLLFTQAGPALYVEGEAVRRGLSAEFYGLALDGAGNAPTASGPIAVLNRIASGPDEAMGALGNQFGPFIPSDRYIDGLDLAMAYTLSTGDDVVYALTPLPEDFSAAYFPPPQGPLFFLSMSAQERADSINQGLSGVSRLAMAAVVIVFGLFEQAIYLCLSVAAGVLFISMTIALLFAFFERTEIIARTLIDMWLELFILSVVIAVVQAFAVGLVTLGARTLNPTLTLGASVIGGIVMAVLLMKALGAIWDSLNRMFSAMSGTVGGGLLSPAEAGASLAQLAGGALSGMDSLYSASALGSFVLPESSPLKGRAQGFYEGALSNRMMGPLGGLFLAEGGFGQGRPSQPPPETASPALPASTAGGAAASRETDIRFDSADLSGLREAVETALRQAQALAPPGGYRTEEAARQALRDALGTVPLAGSPSAYAAGDPRMGEYLERQAPSVSSQLLLRSQGKGGSETQDTQAGESTRRLRSGGGQGT